MSNPTEIEAALFLLKDFLEREKERERKGVTIEKVYEQNEGLHRKVDAVERQQQLIIRDQIAQGMRIDRYGKRLRKVEKKVFNEEEDTAANDEETTGNYRVIEVQRAAEIAELRRRADAVEAEKKKEAEERQWWTRWGWKLVAGILLAFFGATCTTGGGVAAYYLTKGAMHP